MGRLQQFDATPDYLRQQMMATLLRLSESSGMTPVYTVRALKPLRYKEYSVRVNSCRFS